MRTGNSRQLRQGHGAGVPAISAYRADPVTPLLRIIGLLLLATYLMLVGWVALRPVPVAWVYDANLQPLSSIRRALAVGTAEEYRRLAINMLLMAPLGVLLPLAGGRVAAHWLPSLLRTVGAAALLCVGLEFLQAGVPGHVLDVDDVLLNMAGVTVAHLAVVPALRALLRHRRPHRISDDGPPSGTAHSPGGLPSAEVSFPSRTPKQRGSTSATPTGTTAPRIVAPASGGH